MRLEYDAVDYVRVNGNIYEKLYLAYALGEVPDPELLHELTGLQNRDGGWPWQFQGGEPSGVGATARVLELLLKTGLERGSETCSQAVSFLLSLQREDGGWAENPELSDLIPKDWIWVSTAGSMTHITGDVINALIEAGESSNPSTARAVAFLKKTQNEEGGWPSHLGSDYTHGTDIAGMDVIVKALLGAGEPKDSQVFKRAIEVVVREREDWKLPVCGASVLNLFTKLGFGPDHEYVRELAETLIEKQRPDGGWNWVGDLPSNPAQTVYTVKQLKKCGVELS
jgi:hypothetical protein